KYLLEHEHKSVSLKKLQTAVDYQTAKSQDMAEKDLRTRVASLREEWDRSEAATSQRRRQLEGLAADSGRSLDDRRRELEAWLARMEARLDRQGVAGPGHSLEALEAQLREQRLLNAELGKWKAAVDSVTRLAHKAASEPRANAMTVPMQEDSARLVAAVENINQRFADLSINVQSRGQALQSALSSLQQMEKALDRFLVWLADSEATLDVLETEADRYGPRDDVHRSCGFQDRIRLGSFLLDGLCRPYRLGESADREGPISRLHSCALFVGQLGSFLLDGLRRPYRLGESADREGPISREADELTGPAGFWHLRPVIFTLWCVSLACRDRCPEIFLPQACLACAT
ncbi:hypothetical protein HPB47_021765, partial [Ixodes persulcatus]